MVLYHKTGETDLTLAMLSPLSFCDIYYIFLLVFKSNPRWVKKKQQQKKKLLSAQKQQLLFLLFYFFPPPPFLTSSSTSCPGINTLIGSTLAWWSGSPSSPCPTCLRSRPRGALRRTSSPRGERVWSGGWTTWPATLCWHTVMFSSISWHVGWTRRPGNRARGRRRGTNWSALTSSSLSGRVWVRDWMGSKSWSWVYDKQKEKSTGWTQEILRQSIFQLTQYLTDAVFFSLSVCGSTGLSSVKPRL